MKDIVPAMLAESENVPLTKWKVTGGSVTDEGVDSLIHRLDFLFLPQRDRREKNPFCFSIILFKALKLFNFAPSNATSAVRDHLRCCVNIIRQCWMSMGFSPQNKLGIKPGTLLLTSHLSSTSLIFHLELSAGNTIQTI